MQKVNQNGKTFVRGAAIIAAAHLLIKLFGALYKIPLDRMILGTAGMGIYNAAYYIYNWMFVISTAGLPVAISRMVSASDALGHYRETERIFSVAKWFMLFVGFAGFCVLFFGADFFAHLLNADAEGMSVALAIRALAPSIFFVALMAAYRGYTQGRGNMIPTAVSEIAEAAGKLGIGLVLAAMLVKSSLAGGAAGAIGGVSCGAALGLLAIFLIGFRGRRAAKARARSDETAVRSKRSVFKELLSTAVPITLGASVFTMTSLIDTAMVFHLLDGVGFNETQYYSLSGYLGRAVTMFNLPPTVVAALAVSVVPALAAALAVGDRKAAARTTASAIRITLLISLPCAIGLSVLASPILGFVYNDANHAFLLNVMGLAVAFVTLVQVSNAILQAHGKVWLPVAFMTIGGLVKVVVNFLLIRQPGVHIYGAPIGTLMCYATVMVLNIVQIHRVSGLKLGKGAVVKPLLSGVLMGAVAWGTYTILSGVVGDTLALLCAIGAGALVYFIMLLLTRGILAEDVLLLPKGEMFLRLFVKFGLMKGEE